MTPIQEIPLILDNPLYFFESRIFIIFQVLSGITSIIFFFLAWRFWWRGQSFQRHLHHVWTAWNASPIPIKRMMRRWASIKKSLESDDETSWRRAIIDADKMLDEILKKVGYEGQTMEKRLENIHIDQFPSLEDAWRAHRVRKFLDEDPDYPLKKEVAERAFEIYKNIFRETGLII